VAAHLLTLLRSQDRPNPDGCAVGLVGGGFRHLRFRFPERTRLDVLPRRAPKSSLATKFAVSSAICRSRTRHEQDLGFVASSRRSHQMRKIRWATVSALVVLGLGSAACTSPVKSQPKATAKNSTASASSAPTSTTAVPSTVAPTSAPSTTTPSNPPTTTTTTTFVLPTTTVVPGTAVRRVRPPRTPKPPGPGHRCPPGDLGKSTTLSGVSVVCTHTATGYFWEPAP
jgi:hypothetical protein